MGSSSMSPHQILAAYVLVILLPASTICGGRRRQYGHAPARGQGDQVPTTVTRRMVRRRKVSRGGDSDNVIIVQNYDKSALWTLLGNKEMRVGEVVLVNGKPAVIK